MDIGYVTTLNRIAYEESKSEEVRRAKAAQDMQDTMHDEM